MLAVGRLEDRRDVVERDVGTGADVPAERTCERPNPSKRQCLDQRDLATAVADVLVERLRLAAEDMAAEPQYAAFNLHGFVAAVGDVRSEGVSALEQECVVVGIELVVPAVCRSR